MDDLGLVSPGSAFFFERFKVTTPDERTDRGQEPRCLMLACKQYHSDIVHFALRCVLCLTPCCPLFTPQGSSALKLVMMMLSTHRRIRVRKKQLSSGQTPAEICQSENENKGRPIRIRKSHIDALVSV